MASELSADSLDFGHVTIQGNGSKTYGQALREFLSYKDNITWHSFIIMVDEHRGTRYNLHYIGNNSLEYSKPSLDGANTITCTRLYVDSNITSYDYTDSTGNHNITNNVIPTNTSITLYF